jgi:hypothetical protein
VQYLDIVMQETFGVEGRLFVEDEFSGIAPIDIIITIGAEECVGLEYLSEVV